MGTAVKHPVSDRVKPSFVFFDIRALWRSAPSVRVCPDVKNYKWRLNPVWHRMLYSCTDMATVGVKGLTNVTKHSTCVRQWLLLTVFLPRFLTRHRSTARCPVDAVMFCGRFRKNFTSDSPPPFNTTAYYLFPTIFSQFISYVTLLCYTAIRMSVCLSRKYWGILSWTFSTNSSATAADGFASVYFLTYFCFASMMIHFLGLVDRK